MLSLTSVSASEDVTGDVPDEFMPPCQRVHAMTVTVYMAAGIRNGVAYSQASCLDHSATAHRICTPLDYVDGFLLHLICEAPQAAGSAITPTLAFTRWSLVRICQATWLGLQNRWQLNSSKQENSYIGGLFNPLISGRRYWTDRIKFDYAC